jgi:hypothetical protein
MFRDGRSQGRESSNGNREELGKGGKGSCGFSQVENIIDDVG